MYSAARPEHRPPIDRKLASWDESSPADVGLDLSPSDIGLRSGARPTSRSPRQSPKEASLVPIRCVYRLITTILDPRCPAGEIVGLYHERWGIETSFCELKSTTLGGRVLRARTPTGVDQEIYALLIGYQALRIAISDAVLARPDLDPDRGSFTVALNTARDQLIAAAGVIADTVIDVVGVIGRRVLARLMPARRTRTNPRVVKRAISKFVASSKKGRHRRPSCKATISIDILAATGP